MDAEERVEEMTEEEIGKAVDETSEKLNAALGTGYCVKIDATKSNVKALKAVKNFSDVITEKRDLKDIKSFAGKLKANLKSGECCYVFGNLGEDACNKLCGMLASKGVTASVVPVGDGVEADGYDCFSLILSVGVEAAAFEMVCDNVPVEECHSSPFYNLVR